MGLWAGIYWNGEPQWFVYKKQCGNGARHETGIGLEEVSLTEFLVINAVGRFGGMVVAWNEIMFTRVDAWTGQFSVGVKLTQQTYAFEMVVVSAYGPVNAIEEGSMEGAGRNGSHFPRVSDAIRTRFQCDPGGKR